MDADLLTSLTRLLSPILSSPDALRSLSSLLGGEGETSEEREGISDAVEAVAEPTTKERETGERAKRREALLRALRPYLSEEKGARLEGLVRASSMLELLGGAGRS